ncbi:HAD family hydrolase [Rugosimonospora africana]|uniref:Haloacid dehalogenase n=1 Tax=Rugosimonospora africana TaxID=556532 RepID=A0A8J3R0H3_9ACTN|nr:HAD family phosphatase [Rugosimonospora africana]GIH19397.1 haloacid dehalogenase [Rugosimonospora africana]
MNAESGGANDTSIAAVLFDMDGTLFDSERIWDVSLADLAHKLGGRLSARARERIVGSNLLTTVRIVQSDLGVSGDDQDLAAWLLDRTCRLFAAGVPWRPGAQELVAAVRSRRIPAALVTGSFRVLVDVVLDQIPADTFGLVICGDEVDHPKPDPEPYVTAAGLLGVSPANCVAIEDSRNGIRSAVDAGCLVIAVPEEPQQRADDHGVLVRALPEITVDWLDARMRHHRLVALNRMDHIGEQQTQFDRIP